jgi:hypothetical protein
MKEEFVPNDRVVWNSDRAMNYQCPVCLGLIKSQYEGEAVPEVVCHGPQHGHTLRWDTA